MMSDSSRSPDREEQEMSTDKSGSGVDREVATASPSLINSKNHEPGRELDALIAEKVMGWREVMMEGTRAPGHTWFVPNGIPPEGQFGKIRFVSDPYKSVPFYSTFIADAWKVVEWMQTLGGDLDLMLHSRMPSPWTARFPSGPEKPASHDQVHADTAPLAICLAALRAVDA